MPDVDTLEWTRKIFETGKSKVVIIPSQLLDLISMEKGGTPIEGKWKWKAGKVSFEFVEL